MELPTNKQIALAEREARNTLKTNDFILLFEVNDNGTHEHYISLDHLLKLQEHDGWEDDMKHYSSTYYANRIWKGAIISKEGFERLQELKIVLVVISDE